MELLHRLAVRWRAIAHRAVAEEELDEELRYHLAREIERNVAAGIPPREAEIAARRAFGNVGVHKDAVRDTWGLGWLERLTQDVRYAIRSFRRAPAFVLTVAATIGLGLGLTTTVFTIFDAYVLRPIAVRDPRALFEFAWVDRNRQDHRFTHAQFEEIRRDRQVFSDVLAYRTIITRFGNRPAPAQLVSENFFEMLGVRLALGRGLTAQDVSDAAGSPVAVLNYDFWRNSFGSDSAILGRRVSIRGYPVEVVGVAADGFGGIGEVPPDFWLPLTMRAVVEPDERLTDGTVLRLVGRLRRGESEDRAQSFVAEWARRATADWPPRNKAVGAVIIPRATAVTLTPDVVAITLPVIIAFGLLLLIACANVANMMLARGLARQREIGIRLALGAGRGRLVRQLMTESVLLALPAGVLAFAVSRLTLDGGFRLMFASLPAEFGQYFRFVPLLPDARVFAFIVCAALVSALAFGLAPAIQATRPRVVQATRGDFDTPFRPGRFRHALILGQITVCVVLLVCAGVLLRTSRRLERLDVGITTRDVIQINLRDQRRSQHLDALRRAPGVRAIAAATAEPLDARFPQVAVLNELRQRATASFSHVSPAYFTVLGIPILRGRAFNDDEARSHAPVVVASEGAARQLWPGQDPIGQLVRLADDSLARHVDRLTPYRVARVIGVARNAVPGWIGVDLNEPVFYYPSPIDAPDTHLLIQTTGDTEGEQQRLTELLAPTVDNAIVEVRRLEDYRALQVYPFRATHWVSSALGIIALALTLTGIYGVLSYAVAQRTKEFGIRMALGASPPGVIALVLGESVRLAIVGIAGGVVLAMAVSSLFASRVQILNAFDLVGYAGGAVLVFVTALVAAYVPSRRAAAVDPLRALRHD